MATVSPWARSPLGLVWIVYLFKSERVKATFLVKNIAEVEPNGRTA